MIVIQTTLLLYCKFPWIYLVVFLLTGTSVISPWMNIRIKSTLLFVRILIFFLNLPGILPVPLYVTTISPEPPGEMKSLGYSATVHPHEACTAFITSLALPTFLNLKTAFCTGSSMQNSPMSIVVFSNLISGYFFALTPKANTNSVNRSNNFVFIPIVLFNSKTSRACKTCIYYLITKVMQKDNIYTIILDEFIFFCNFARFLHKTQHKLWQTQGTFL